MEFKIPEVATHNSTYELGEALSGTYKPLSRFNVFQLQISGLKNLIKSSNSYEKAMKQKQDLENTNTLDRTQG